MRREINICTSQYLILQNAVVRLRVTVREQKSASSSYMLQSRSEEDRQVRRRRRFTAAGT